MIKKLQEHHQKLDQLKQSQTPKNDIKQLLKDRRKERLESATLPNFAKVVDDQLECSVCNSIHIDLTSFKLHVPQAAHQSALLALKEKIKLRKEEELVKRKAQTSVETLQHETTQQQDTIAAKPKRLTREQIERINREIEEEFGKDQGPIVQQNPSTKLPENFFEQIEQEIKDQLEPVVEDEPEEIVKSLKQKVLKPQQKQSKSSKYDFMDVLMDEEGERDILRVEWKEKKLT